MGNVINNCFGGGNNGVHFLIEKKFSIDLLRDPNTLLVDLRDWDEYKQKHFRTAINLPINKIKLTERKLDISQIFKDSGLRDFIEYFLVNSKQQNDSNEWNDSPYFQVIFYTNEGPVKDALLIQTLYEHREFLRGMSVNCFLLCEGFQKLASEMVGKENEEYFSNTMKYRLKNRNLFINDGTVTEIIENFLLIGSHDNASDTGLLKGFHINNLVNLSEKELDYQPKNVEIKTFSISPNLDSNFLPQLPPIFEYLETMKEKKEKVLLFCENGVRVAASVGMAYLMKSKKWTLLQSFNYLYELQPSVRPSIGFMRHLLEMEAVLFPSLSFPSFPIKCYILFYNQLEDIESNLKFVTTLNDINVEEFTVVDDNSPGKPNGEENDKEKIEKKDDNNNNNNNNNDGDKRKEDNDVKEAKENKANDLQDVKENKESNEVKKDDEEKKEDNIKDDTQN